MNQQYQYQGRLAVCRPPDQITFEMRLNYFKDRPVGPRTRVYVYAVLLVLSMILFHNLLWTVVCAILLILIVLSFVRWVRELSRPTMTDQEYDRWIWWHLGVAKDEGERKFEIPRLSSEVQAQEPQVIRGFVYLKDPDARFYRFLLQKRGEDGRFRSSISRFIVIYLLEHELGIYTRDINALGTDCIKKDSSQYYEMVTGIKMDTYGHFGADGNDASDVPSADYFAVVMASGEKIGVSVLSQDDQTEKTVAQLRRLLAAKKYTRGNSSGGSGGYPGMSNTYPGGINGYPGILNGFPGGNSYPGFPPPGNTGPFAPANGYLGNGFPGGNSYPGFPPGNTGPFAGTGEYPGGAPPYLTNMKSDSQNPGS